MGLEKNGIIVNVNSKVGMVILKVILGYGILRILEAMIVKTFYNRINNE